MSFMFWKKKKGKVQKEDTGYNRYFIGYTSEPPTLQHIAAVSIASRLWSESDIKEDVRQYSESSGFDSRTRLAAEAYEEFEKRVLKKLDNIPLPNTLKCKVSDIFHPIGLQLLKGFAKEIEEYYYYGETVPNENKGYCRFYDIFKVGGSVYWTMEGVIDNVTSLKELINNEDQEKDFNSLFDLACKYCLEEYIPGIWKTISSDKKNDIVRANENYDSHIVAYWTASIESRLFSLFDKLKQADVDNIYHSNLSIEQNMISLSIHVKNPYSLKYFWKKMKEQDRNSNLEKWLNQAIQKFAWERHEYQNCNDKTNILCFLLSQLNIENQQKEAFQADSKIILKALFFDWPWQTFFYPTFIMMLDYVSEESFIEIMSLISKRFKVEKTSIEMFKEIWCKSSIKLKKALIKHLKESAKIIFRFIREDDVQTIFMILKYATMKETKEILFNMIGSYELFAALRSNKLSLIDALVTKYLTSKSEIKKFKSCVMLEDANDLCKNWMNNNNFQAVEMLFTWGFESPDEIKKFKEKLIDKNKIYSSLVCEGDYEMVNRFLTWSFESDDEIEKFKKAFIREVDEDNSSICSELLWEFSVHREGWDLFEKFVNYSLCSTEEITEFKSKFLESVTSFLESYQFEFAEKFLIWCLGSVEESNRFKNSFVTSKKGMNFVLNAVNKGHPVFHYPNELIKWLSISEESAEILKHKLDNVEFFSDFCSETAADYKRWALMYLLDKHVGNNVEYKEDSDSDDSKSDITIEIMKAYQNSQ